MLARLRRLPWIAFLCIVLSPAIGGTALPMLHPCPVDAPWLASDHGSHGDATTDAQAHHGPAAPHDASDAPDNTAHNDCSCVGCCAAPPLAAPPSIAILATAVLAPIAPFWSVLHHDGHAERALERLPESTAPPLV